jgi:hypothetical protein
VITTGSAPLSPFATPSCAHPSPRRNEHVMNWPSLAQCAATREVLAPGGLERQREVELFVRPDDANVFLAHEQAQPSAFLASVAHVEVAVRELGRHVAGADLREEDPGARVAPALDADGALQ